MEFERKKYIIDCDAGCDDAFALIMLIAARKSKNLDILGITCTGGNTALDNVIRNVFRTLEICNALDIPVYKGVATPILDTEDARKHRSETLYHGIDGLGDCFDDEVNTDLLEKEHAVNAMHRIVNEYPGKVSLVCLAPLTNVAMAMRMYPNFVKNIDQLYVMGGNDFANGSQSTEFNFLADLESVNIVLNTVEKPILLLTFEACFNDDLSQLWRDQVFAKIPTYITEFLNKIEKCWSTGKCVYSHYVPCDAIMAAIVIDPNIIDSTTNYKMNIELHGEKSRGQIVRSNASGSDVNVTIIGSFKADLFKQFMIWTVQQFGGLKEV